MTACAEAPAVATAREVLRPDYPAALFRCAAWPAPAEAPRDLFGLIAWLAEAKVAHADCSHRLACAGEAVGAGAGAEAAAGAGDCRPASAGPS